MNERLPEPNLCAVFGMTLVPLNDISQNKNES